MSATQSLYAGGAGRTLLHVAEERWDDVQQWAKSLTGEPINADPASCGLFNGAPAVAFALRLADRPSYGKALATLDRHIDALTEQRLDTAHARMDRGQLPRLSEFDLMRGLTGLGVHHLVRDARSSLLGDVLAYLVRLTQPIEDHQGLLPGWWTGDSPSLEPSPHWPDGHGNFGMAHGIAGPLALLAISLRRGINVPGQADSVRYICSVLDRLQNRDGLRIWWPEILTRGQWRGPAPYGKHPGRPSWCYGTPGIARAQQLAGLSLADTPRQKASEHALAECAANAAQLTQLVDHSICHGWAGLIRTLWRAAGDAGPDNPLHTVLRDLMRHLGQHTAQGDGLMEGSAGIRLVQLTTSTALDAPAWDTCLLLTG